MDTTGDEINKNTIIIRNHTNYEATVSVGETNSLLIPPKQKSHAIVNGACFEIIQTDIVINLTNGFSFQFTIEVSRTITSNIVDIYDNKVNYNGVMKDSTFMREPLIMSEFPPEQLLHYPRMQYYPVMPDIPDIPDMPNMPLFPKGRFEDI